MATGYYALRGNIIGHIKFNEKEYPLDSIIISNEKNVTEYLLKYYDDEKLKELSITLIPDI